jgi:hypothetical protein
MALADALMLLQAAKLDVEEIEVAHEVVERLGASALTRADLGQIERSAPLRPTRWYDYVYAIYESKHRDARVWSQFHRSCRLVSWTRDLLTLRLISS